MKPIDAVWNRDRVRIRDRRARAGILVEATTMLSARYVLPAVGIGRSGRLWVVDLAGIVLTVLCVLSLLFD